MDKYDPIRVLGEGSFGKVYLMRDKQRRKFVCVKVIKIKNVPKKERDACRMEVELLRRLNHPNIVGYIDSFLSRNKESLCIAMEYCDGGDLASQIKAARGRPFSESKVLHWFVQIALGLHYMHYNRILHRDLKTQNIFLLGNGRLVLGDLGISKVMDGTMDFAKTCIGTPYYMSPEIFKNKPYNHKSDVWALGCVLYEMITLNHAFDANTFNGLAAKIIKGRYPSVNSKYSACLRELVSEMLMTNPAQRPDMDDILRKAFCQKHIQNFLSDIVSRPSSNIGEGTMAVRAAVVHLAVGDPSKDVAAALANNPDVRALKQQLESLNMQGVMVKAFTPPEPLPRPDSPGKARKLVKEQASALQREEEHKQVVEAALNKLRQERESRNQARQRAAQAPPPPSSRRPEIVKPAQRRYVPSVVSPPEEKMRGNAHRRIVSIEEREKGAAAKKPARVDARQRELDSDLKRVEQLQDYGVRQPDRRDPPKVPSAFDQAKAENAKRDAAREIEREKQRLDLEQLRKDKVELDRRAAEREQLRNERREKDRKRLEEAKAREKQRELDQMQSKLNAINEAVDKVLNDQPKPLKIVERKHPSMDVLLAAVEARDQVLIRKQEKAVLEEARRVAELKGAEVEYRVLREKAAQQQRNQFASQFNAEPSARAEAGSPSRPRNLLSKDSVSPADSELLVPVVSRPQLMENSPQKNVPARLEELSTAAQPARRIHARSASDEESYIHRPDAAIDASLSDTDGELSIEDFTVVPGDAREEEEDLRRREDELQAELQFASTRCEELRRTLQTTKSLIDPHLHKHAAEQAQLVELVEEAVDADDGSDDDYEEYGIGTPAERPHRASKPHLTGEAAHSNRARYDELADPASPSGKLTDRIRRLRQRCVVGLGEAVFEQSYKYLRSFETGSVDTHSQDYYESMDMHEETKMKVIASILGSNAHYAPLIEQLIFMEENL